ncbi:MAG: MotA/TolQ/ExbB proton channel family protein [Sulfurimonas sp.]|nr:MotA/TolQ/ExbB proton channel family protein [Sulfurimonas sp.]MDD3059432.1 MotA/TolQ/ExbB proton channel family protein [Sulfurimonas sp.]MDD5201634.1 MotA/TolQ/ExbB proton channel family protein [Sulfurimonas sp.]
MKHLTLILLLAFSLLNADELSDAYQKEYTFLKAQKSELASRLKQEKSFHEKEIQNTQTKVITLQNEIVALSQKSQALQKQIEKSSLTLDERTSNKDITSSVIIQAKSILNDYGIAVNDAKDADAVAAMHKAFEDTAALYTKLSSVQKIKGSFYLADGTTAEGDIIKVGNIAAFGISSKASGALAPAGNGEYKLWNVETSAEAAAFAKGAMTKDTKLFIYENLDKDVEYAKEKTFNDTLEGGGTIGYIILGLGALGLILVLLRVLLLLKSGSNVKEITSIVVAKVEAKQANEAIDAIKEYKGATARVIKATLRNIDKERDHIEDIVTENILNESSNIDKFGSFVLVLAAVAPLLGLLGTVTGMIATFDVITTHGTGDPKLLSGGISEALITTEFGLIVAVPLLLLGNLLSGWAQNIKDSMEQAALHIVNVFAINKA